MVSDSPEPVLLDLMIHSRLCVQKPLMKVHMFAQLLHLLLAVRGTQGPETWVCFFLLCLRRLKSSGKYFTVVRSFSFSAAKLRVRCVGLEKRGNIVSELVIG